MINASKSAVMSPCGRYRYVLRREWSMLDVEPRRLCWVMLNPSTADAERDDPTIRRCYGFAHRWGYSAFDVVNLFALRSRDPKALKARPSHEVVGVENDEHIVSAALGAYLVVAAWGAHGGLYGRDHQVLQLLASIGCHPRVLGLTDKGQPRHPLFVDYGAGLIEWRRSIPGEGQPMEQPPHG